MQRRFTKRIPGLGGLSYPQRLCLLKLPSLELRRLHFDLIMVYKIIHGLVELDPGRFFVRATSTTRGHSFKLMKVATTRFDAHFFSNRVINFWNFLPEYVVSAGTLRLFRSRLLSVNLNRFLRGRGLGLGQGV